MIKAIIMDVDGVIVGKKLGINFPLPNEKVIETLKKVRQQGIPIILCTAKFNYAIHEIIKSAELKNPHITDGGALILDLISNKTITKHVFDKGLAKDISSSCISKNIYLEAYDVDDYFVQKSQVNVLTKRRTELLQKDPKLPDMLQDQIDMVDMIKFISFAENEDGKAKIEKALTHLNTNINLMWSEHPAFFPMKFGIITIKGVSKKHASLEVLEYLKISPSETLGIGDLLSDWNFIEICKYAGTVGDHSPEFKKLTQTKGEGKFFHGSSVDENGFIDIINYFKHVSIQ